MDLKRMLEKCEAGQWRTEDIDWNVPRRAMSPDEEMAVVQYFTDMAGIERLAAALFEEQQARAEDPTLARIFATFVEDERRHARCAELLALYYDTRHLKQYRMNDELVAFTSPFVNALRHLSAEVANVYVTMGELMLDVALLRSIDDFVDDEMSRQVMTLINRDESRHIAMDFYMTEYYASAEYQAWLARQRKKPASELVQGLLAFALVMRHARPFLRAVFLDPMKQVDPSGERMREAFARFEALIAKPHVRRRPLPQIIHQVKRLAAHPRTKPLATRIARAGGIPKQLLGLAA